MAPFPTKRATSRRRRPGFTLIEAAWVTVIIGLGVLATMELLAVGTASNAAGNQMTAAVNLANNVHEIALSLPLKDPQQPTQWIARESTVAAYDNVLDLDGHTFSPPLDVRRQPILDYMGWSQQVKLQSVALDNLSSIRPNTTTIPTAKLTVRILHHNKLVHEVSWLIVGPSPG